MFRRRPRLQPRRARRSRLVRLERLEQRQLLAAQPLGATPLDTGEFLLGTVTVTPVLFESNGATDPSSEDWTAEEIDQVLAKVTEGVNWWRDTLASMGTVHSLEFVIDDTFAVNPVPTPYEPISRPSTDFTLYAGDFITAQGYGNVTLIEDGVRQFNHAQRVKFGTDWAFTIFIADSSGDSDGLFAAGNSFAAAFAYPGGLFIVSPSTRGPSTFAHEMGHIFWARDEYPGGGSWTDRRGYYDTQNLNAADNPTPGFVQEISIMRGGVPLSDAFAAHVSPESTLAMVGWQDSDGDGVFDVADVPLRLEGIGYFDPATSDYHFRGDASAVPLLNRNSSGNQSDITLNRISQLQYRLDQGNWQVAAAPDLQAASFDLTLPIETPFSQIEWRVIDLQTGITSPVLDGSLTLPAISNSSLSGIAFLDGNGNGTRDAEELPLAMTEIIVSKADGSPLFAGGVDAEAMADGQLPAEINGASLTADGALYGNDVGVFASLALGGPRVFHALDLQRNRWVDRWSSKVAFQASFDEPVGEVALQAIGFGDASYARLEAYDASGQLIARTTSDAIGFGESATVRVVDPTGRIASIRAMGHAGSSIAVAGVEFGTSGVAVTDASGAWRLANLPDGAYRVDYRPERVIHQFSAAPLTVEVAAGTSSLLQAGADRVDSPLHNAGMGGDVNGDGKVSASDALTVINDLSRFNPRVLVPSDPSTFQVDVSNDGVVSALDALLVINYLGVQPGGSGELVSGSQAEPVPAALAFSAPAPSSPGDVADDPLEDSVFWSPLVDSAGSDPEGESINAGSADSREERELGGESGRSGKIRGFSGPTDTIPPDLAVQGEFCPNAADRVESVIDLIWREMSEPFGEELI